MGDMPELLGSHGGGVCRNFSGLRRGYAGNFVGSGGVCQNYCGLRGGYAGTFLSLGGGMPELFGAQGRGMPEVLWA